MSPAPTTSTIGGVLQSILGEVQVLHWKPRLVAIAVVLALVLVALGGLGIEVGEYYNLYW
jgi:hypothetical protein